ncbi:MAG: hypothetical protein Q9162_007749 [Coniocarpon cinnabarinum]
MPSLNILISGCGIAGPVAAFWLSKACHNVTIVERSPSPRKTGQSIDIREKGVTIMRRMGLEAIIRARGTHEKGFAKIDRSGAAVASFDATGDPSAQTHTSEFEILRGDLASIFTEAVDDQVEIVYGEYIKAIQQQEDRVDVTFAHGKPRSSYDLIIGADGLYSGVRSLLTGVSARSDIHKLDAYCALFTIPRAGSDSDTHCRYYNTSLGRGIATRPTPSGESGACLIVVAPFDDRFSKLTTAKPEEQKQVFREFFADAGYEAERILAGMEQANDFYFQEIAQVRRKKYYEGRAALLGDAAFCPSPFSGMGTSSAMYAAYVLAGEISKQPHDLNMALQNYDNITRAWVEPLQDVPMRFVRLFNPQTQVVVDVENVIIRLVRVVVTVATLFKLDKVFSRFFGEGATDHSVPEYEWDDKKAQ